MKLRNKGWNWKKEKGKIEKKRRSLTVHMISEFPIRMPSLLVKKGYEYWVSNIFSPRFTF